MIPLDQGGSQEDESFRSAEEESFQNGVHKKAISQRNILDGTPFDVAALVGDPVNRCVWLGGEGTTSRGAGRLGIWRYDGSQVVTRVTDRATELGGPFLPVALAKGWYRSSGNILFVPMQRLWFDLSYHSGRHSSAFDGTNAVDVMLDVPEVQENGHYSAVTKTCLVRRNANPVLFTVLPDGTRFPEPVSVHATDSGVIAILEDGSVALLRRKDMKQTYLDAECQAVSGNPDESRLLRAAAGGDQDELSRTLDAGGQIESTDGEGKTALMYAAREGQSAAAGLLLDRGANPRAKSIGGVSVLSYAAQSGDTGTAGRLLQMGAEPSQRSKVGMTPLLYAASAGHADMVRLLLARGANRDDADRDGRNALGLAIECQSVPVVDCLLHSGMNPNAQGRRGITPLVLASERDNMEIVRMLCKAGANMEVLVDVGGDGEMNPGPLLAKAATAGQVNLVKELLRAGAKIEAVDGNQSTPLIHASSMGHAEAAVVLLDAGAKIEAVNKWGCRSLDLAVYWKRPDVVRVLIERKANVNVQDNNGDTPLHAASSTKQWDIVKLLLANGADPKIKNKKGEPAMVPDVMPKEK